MKDLIDFNKKIIDVNKWEGSIYKPTPTIIEALYGVIMLGNFKT